ncbi:MAG: V-type ATP synthase subunit C [Clostridioides sp.]|jgi:V/A-type H+-transporting ATPase subunit C|nr:V-type ATP synthase subunit C [Clostridioides sp.]
MEFTHAVTHVRVMEKRLLDADIIERLLDSQDPEDTLKILQETYYGDMLNNIDSVYDYEVALKKALIDLYKEIYKISPQKEIVDIMSVKYDFHNMRVLLKAKALGKDFSELLIHIGTIDIENLKNFIDTGDTKALDIKTRDMIEDVEGKFNSTLDPQVIDVALDKYMFMRMSEMAVDLDIPYITKYVRESIDVTNIKIMVRCKKQKKDSRFFLDVAIPGGYLDLDILDKGINESIENFANNISRTSYSKAFNIVLDEFLSKGRVSSLDTAYDNYLMDSAKEAKRVSFGPEPILGYIIAVETEIKLIRIIMVGKLNNVSKEVIRERLREVYV